MKLSKKNLPKKIAVIFYGPPGAGKGTQAQLLADKLNLFHFDTGRYIRDIIYDPTLQKNKIIQKERKINEAGGLNTASWIFEIVSKKIDELNKLNKSVVLSGSPRTMAETFGDKKTKGLIELLEKDYGKKNIFIIALNLTESESLKRNTHRLICSQCRLAILSSIPQFKNLKMSKCPFCGGDLKHRFDDKKEVILRRLESYKEMTYPIIGELAKRKYRIIKINAAPLPYQVHQKIIGYLK
ncbi:nucleoside monophosphate kinase [Candidatus Wolfebacteria bacterium]|nr:nucleoside monophosphate kinase [Candidatus Wolfebacteria bacterium]